MLQVHQLPKANLLKRRQLLNPDLSEESQRNLKGVTTEALSVLMLWAPSNRQWPSYNTKMADFELVKKLT